MVEQQSIRINNQLDREAESTEKNSKHQLICDVLALNLEFVPETVSEIEAKFKSFKNYLKNAGRESTKLSSNLGIRQFQLGLILFISSNIRQYKPSLWDPKFFEVKSSVNPKEKCKLAVEKFRTLDILTLIENDQDEV